ncbi:MAG: hypothetical protein M1391_10360 [Bacteroidetes bacterium]|nr:hypothetical protein [Bacteroidota bacterium]
MKKYFLLLFILFSVVACSKKEVKLELFSAESFAYSLDKGWEADASVRVKGFEQTKNNGTYAAKLSYTVDLETPDGKVIKSIDSGKIDKTSAEKMIDLQINSQIQLDSNYKLGSYKLVFNVTDDPTGRKSSIQTSFDLTN